MIYSPGGRLALLLALSAALSVGEQSQLGSAAEQLRASATIPLPRPNLSIEMRGDILMARKMYREAVDMYRQGPSDSPVLANKIGIAFHQMLVLDLARKNYERAVKLNPKYSEAINNIGTIYYAQKSYRRSINYYKKALRFAPQSASVCANLGASYFARHNYDQASTYYEQALKLDPEIFERHSHFGTIMQQRNAEDRALFHLYLAKMYAKQGSNENALLYLRKALEEGVKDRDKISTMAEFASLKLRPDFQELLLQNPKPL